MQNNVNENKKNKKKNQTNWKEILHIYIKFSNTSCKSLADY